ncbi:RNA polymerase sigma factor [Kibdelosporangium aridum]|uniref:RNA polymerase sigma factor n=1 Tax=Kibdelosporangium aridum TaxID=2030 RepID=UPI000F7BA456|nr:sigma-70 family RNA polymerase sigma factor [Kibdelosporangium aridum]
MASTDNGDLVARLRSTESDVRHQAQTQLYELCRVQLVPYFRRRLRYASEVDDYVHEVFTGALETIRRGNDPQNVAAWLTGIAQNLLVKHYQQLEHRADGEIPEQQSTPAELSLELDKPELTEDELPELTDDLAEILGKRELWRTVRVAISAITPNLSRVMDTHIKLTLREQRRTTTAELASALDMPPDRVERQLHRARVATVTAATALVLARTGRNACSILDGMLSDEQKRAGDKLVLDVKQSKAVAKHAETCVQCAPRADAAGKYVLWAIGPGLIVVSDDDERRRAVAALFSRSDSVPVGNVVAVAEPTVVAVGRQVAGTRPPSGGAFGTLVRVSSSRVMNSVSHIAQDPMVFRAVAGTVAAVVLGVCGLLTSSTPLAPPPPIGEAAPDPADPKPDLVVNQPAPPTTTTPGPTSVPPVRPATPAPPSTPNTPGPQQRQAPAETPKPAVATPGTTPQTTTPNTGPTTPPTSQPSRNGTTTPPPPPSYEDVTVDFTDVAYSTFTVSGADGWHNSKQVHRMRLAPGVHTLSTALGQRFTFTVTDARTVEYDRSLEGTLTGSGTNTLAVHGKPVTLNTADIDYMSTGVGGTYQTAERSHTYKLLPGNHYFVFNNQASLRFAITQQGNVDYAPELAGMLTGAGTKTLAIHGKHITIDTSGIDYAGSTLGGVAWRTPAKTQQIYRLLPGGHYLLTSNGIITTFSITPQGHVAYKPELEGIFTGTGTTTLTAHGKPITINTAELDYANTSLLGLNWKTPDTNRTYRLLPGNHHLVASNGTATILFTITPQGHVTYKPEHQGTLTGTGTTTLTAHGKPITINTAELDYANTSLLGLNWTTPNTNRTYRLLPGNHHLVASNGTATILFTITPQGHVTYKPEYRTVFTGEGTTTLAVHGHPITINTADLDYANTSLLGLNWTTPNTNRTYKLLPGNHHLVTSSGITILFTVTPQGHLTYKPEHRTVFTGEGTTTLVVHGRPITFDLRNSGATGFAVTGLTGRAANTLVTLRLVPGAHNLQLSDGRRFAFRVTEPGHVDYDRSLDAVLSGRGSSTLVVRRARRR